MLFLLSAVVSDAERTVTKHNLKSTTDQSHFLTTDYDDIAPAAIILREGQTVKDNASQNTLSNILVVASYGTPIISSSILPPSSNLAISPIIKAYECSLFSLYCLLTI